MVIADGRCSVVAAVAAAAATGLTILLRGSVAWAPPKSQMEQLCFVKAACVPPSLPLKERRVPMVEWHGV